MKLRTRALMALALPAALAGCAKSGELVVDQGVGISSVLTSCPAVGIPDYTGDITLFRAPGDQTLGNLDLTATITNLRSTCNETGEDVYSEVSFDVQARRVDTNGARTVTLPYFVTALRGGTSVVSKRVGSVTLTFADGADRASATGRGAAFINRADASLPPDIREQITRKRRPGDTDAALDPLTLPEVRAAITRTRFEMLVGFQLTETQLAYNATR
ncbi:MAG: hypothetical protein ACXIT4_13125 [Erythrobacter sp.]